MNTEDLEFIKNTSCWRWTMRFNMIYEKGGLTIKDGCSTMKHGVLSLKHRVSTVKHLGFHVANNWGFLAGAPAETWRFFGASSRLASWKSNKPSGRPSSHSPRCARSLGLKMSEVLVIFGIWMIFGWFLDDFQGVCSTFDTAGRTYTRHELSAGNPWHGNRTAWEADLCENSLLRCHAGFALGETGERRWV